MARGGRRQGQTGKLYANRRDLRETQPIQVPKGGEYGTATAQENAQRAMPLQNAGGVQRQMVQSAQSNMPPPIEPGAFGPLDRSTERPNEALSAMPDQRANLGDPTLANIAPYLPALEMLSTMPDTSQTMRNFIRRVRGQIS